MREVRDDAHPQEAPWCAVIFKLGINPERRYFCSIEKMRPRAYRCKAWIRADSAARLGSQPATKWRHLSSLGRQPQVWEAISHPISPEGAAPNASSCDIFLLNRINRPVRMIPAAFPVRPQEAEPWPE